MLQLAPCRIWLAESQRRAGGEPNESAELPQCLNPLRALKKQHLENLNDPANTSPTPQPGILLKLSAYVNSLKSQVIIRNWGYGTHFMAEETGSTPEGLPCTVIRWLASHTQLHPHSPPALPPSPGLLLPHTALREHQGTSLPRETFHLDHLWLSARL